MEVAETKSGNVVFCAMPKRGRGVGVYEAAIAHYHPSIDPKKFPKIVRATVESSLLTHGFNKMWAAALTLRKSEGVTHFAMIHDDIGTAPGWADILLTEMETFKADVVSVVVPIKDNRGVTSTGLDIGDHFSPRRFTMKEIFEKEETFTDPAIILNTGLWLCDIRKPWCESVHFRQTDQMVVNPDGIFFARTSPEDWDFSRQCRYHGARLYATRKVKLFHHRTEFHNHSVWGEWDTDSGDVAGLPKIHRKVDDGFDKDKEVTPNKEPVVVR